MTRDRRRPEDSRLVLSMVRTLPARCRRSVKQGSSFSNSFPARFRQISSGVARRGFVAAFCWIRCRRFTKHFRLVPARSQFVADSSGPSPVRFVGPQSSSEDAARSCTLPSRRRWIAPVSSPLVVGPGPRIWRDLVRSGQVRWRVQSKAIRSDLTGSEGIGLDPIRSDLI